jgi:hypothetical protein
MTAWSDTVTAFSPHRRWRFGEASGNPIDEQASRVINMTDGDASLVYQDTGAIVGETSSALTAALFDYGDSQFNESLFNGSSQGTTVLWIKPGSSTSNRYVIGWGTILSATSLYIAASTTTILVTVRDGSNTAQTVSATGDYTDWTMLAITYESDGFVRLYVDGVLESTSAGALTNPGFGTQNLNLFRSSAGSAYWVGSIDELVTFSTGLASADVLSLFNAANGVLPSALLPMTLSGYVTTPAASIPVRLRGAVASSVASLPMYLQGPDPAHYGASAAKWAAKVLLNNVDISAQLTQSVTVRLEENASGLATFRLIPGAGAIDLNDFERKSVAIDFVALDSGGATLYTSRRFTGITTKATYNPDSGILTVDCTNDLQGKLENISREAATELIGGQWNKHIFDEDADGWQYAQDRLSTIPSSIWVNQYGQLVVTPWAAKATPDVTLTDSGRFSDTLSLSRVSRRDLISQNTLNIDFRFTRLRHREISVVFYFSYGFCGYLDGAAKIPQKSTILSAADSNAWTRTSTINFTDLPDAGTYCGGKNWIGGTDDFCIGANWKAARRWAQTITEEYALTVSAPDIAEAIGVQAVTESYGVEATYDSTDYENITDFSGPPATSVLSSKTGDYQIDADAAEEDGRTQMELAQTCALAKASTEILSRARGNRLTVGALYNPAINLSSTITVNTPSLVAKGKVFSYDETLNFSSGRPEMSVVLALSRHGGSGSASGDTLDAPTQPDQDQETVTARTYYLGARAGGTINAPADSDEWDGWITNAYGAGVTDPTTLYNERFVLRMPEIEDTARNATEVQAATTYVVEVPEDTLTLSY